MEKVLSRAMGVLVKPSDIANPIYFCLTKESSFVTGTILLIDGGNSIGF